ncbi:MAG: glycerol-3-phosphate 1-O-acyltransferase PlsY [Pseudomonadota bacterium]
MIDAPAPLAFILSAALGYLFGSIPFGLVLTRMAGLGDIRKVGSGNIGATNVLRTGRKDLAAATLVLDIGKAGLAGVAATALFGFEPGLVAGAAAFFGHCFPVWLGFKGGKGVATFAGLLLATMWKVGLLAALTWLSMAVAFRYSSLAALTAAALLPVFTWWMGYGWFAVGVTSFLAVILAVRHSENIKRLLAGTEPKIGASKSASGDAG